LPEQSYEGASQVTRRLLEFWFREEHILPDGSRFEFWRCQREGIEPLIYVYEICRYQSPITAIFLLNQAPKEYLFVCLSTAAAQTLVRENRRALWPQSSDASSS